MADVRPCAAAIACVLLVALFVTVQGHTTACNHGNDETCLYGNATYKGVRQLMNNTEYFWFGSGYNASCPEAAQAKVECFNPAPLYPSIIQRLRFSSDANTNDIEQYLRVHYDVPEGTYHACHSRLSVPATDKHIDPVHTIYNDAWALNHRPHVTWQSESGNKTTLVFWDAGWFQLQGLWINNAGSRLQDGTEVIPYSGPMNPMSRKNPVLFALFRQSRDLTVQEAYTAVQELTTATSLGIPMIKMDELMTTLGLTGPMAVSVIRIAVTGYSAKYGREKNIINNCPYLRTRVMNEEKETLPWNTTATPLSVTVDVVYNSEPVAFNSCCHHHTTKREMIYLDSRAPDAIDAVHLRHVPNCVTLVPTQIRDDPYYFSKPNRMFTLLMLDVTESAHNVTDRATLHWQRINIHDASINTGLTTVQYKPPHVAMSTPERRYVFLLLEQSASLTAETAKFSGSCNPVTSRCVFDLNRFMSERSVNIVGMSLLRAKKDHYSRMQAYTNQGASKATECGGISGFGDPCPTQQTCDSCATQQTCDSCPTQQTCKSAGVLSLPSLFALVMGLLVSLRL